MCFLCFTGYIFLLAFQPTFMFSVSGIALSLLILIILQLITYAGNPNKYNTKLKRVFIILWIAINSSFMIDALFLNPPALILSRDTNGLNISEYLKHFSYPIPFQTFKIWMRNNILGPNLLKNFAAFIMTGFLLSRYFNCISKPKQFIFFQILLSFVLSVIRVITHTGVFSLDQMFLWIISGWIGFLINTYLADILLRQRII